LRILLGILLHCFKTRPSCRTLTSLTAFRLWVLPQLRATGEGHISQSNFRTGIIHVEQSDRGLPPTGSHEPRQIPNPPPPLREGRSSSGNSLSGTDQRLRAVMKKLGESYWIGRTSRQTRSRSEDIRLWIKKRHQGILMAGPGPNYEVQCQTQQRRVKASFSLARSRNARHRRRPA